MSEGAGAPDPERFVPILEPMRALLIKHGYREQAALITDLIDLAHLHFSDLPGKLATGGLWGSAGSVADVVGLRGDAGQVVAETERNSVELRRALIRLADEMRAQGSSSDRSEFVANAFRRGLERRRSRERGG